MKYFRSQNLNPGQVRDHSVWRKANGDIELNPTNNVIINGDLLINGAVPGPEVTNVMYVTMDGNDDNSGLGEGPDQAKRTLKSALAVAQQGTTIMVRSGEYYEDNPLKVPPHVSIIGDSLRNTIIRPLNGPSVYSIINIQRTNNYTTITTSAAHGRVLGDRIRVRCSNTDVDETDVNITDVTEFTVTFRQTGDDIASQIASGRILYGRDLFHVNSKDYIAQMVFKGLRAPAYCINIDSDAIVDTSPYVQNCSNITGPFMNNGEEWLPFITEQPDINGIMVTGPRPLLDSEINPTQIDTYGIDIEGAGGGMLIDGDKYSSQSPIKSMVADAFTQVAQGAVGFHITNFGYMQLVSCFAVFCSKAFYTSRGGYLSISNSVIDFGTEGFVADGFYPDPYAEGDIEQDYFSSVGSVTVTLEGDGYVGTPIAVIDPPATPGGVQATATVNLDSITRRINAISIDNPGSGYDTTPNITISGGSPSIAGEAIVNLSKNSSITVSGLPSKPQIGSIMFLGDDPTAYYISGTVGSVAPFTYDEVKCRRDSGIILDGLYYDVALGTNYNAVINGLSYRRSVASEVIDNQLVQTTGALSYLRDQVATYMSNATAITRSNAAVNEVIDIIENGVAAANVVTFPTPTGAATNTVNAHTQLVNNKAFIRAEIIAWINEQISIGTGIWAGFSYNSTTCNRDLGYIIDALCYDILYGGNSASIVAAQSYFLGSVSVLPTAQRAPTAAAMARLSTVAQQVIQEIAVTVTTGNALSQNFLASPATATEASTADTLIQIIEDVITAGTIVGMPAVVNPSITWADPLIQTAVTQITVNKATIVDDTIDFINSEYATTFSYDQLKCRRDVRLIVNAVLTDAIFGANYQSISAGISYLRSYSSKVLSSQKSQTLAALQEAKTATIALSSNATMQSRIATNFDFVINIITNGLSSVPASFTMPAPVLARSGFPQAAAILNANRTFIQTELTAWIAENYPALVYNSATCQRDISYIIDALRYDLIYGGNSQTINAALSYVEGSVIRGEVEETLETYRYWKTIVGAILRNEVIERTTGNTVTQDITISVGTPVPAPNSPSDVAAELLEIIVKEIDHGPGYIPDPITTPQYSIADSTLNADRVAVYSQVTTIQDAVIAYLQNAYGGSILVNVFPAITSVLTGAQIKFHNVSTISTGGTALEYVGAGVTYNALPFFGGQPIAANERIETNSGKCFTVSNDQVGNYRIGEFFTVNALTGAVTIDAENLNLSGLAAIGPFKRNGIPVGVQLREISDNTNLIASTGAQDGNTAPTQNAVATYVESRYLNKVGSVAQTVVSDINFNGDISIDGDVEIKGADLTTDQLTFNLLDTTATTVNFAGEATDIQIGSNVGTTTVNHELTVNGDTTLGSFTTDQHVINGSLDILAGPVLIQNQDGLEIVSGLTNAGATIQTVGIASTPELFIKSKALEISTGDTPAARVTVNEFGTLAVISNIASSDYLTGSLVVTGGMGISGDLNIQGGQNIGGNLDIAGTIISTTQTSFDLLNSTVTTLNFASSATNINIAAASGTTTISNSLIVDGNTTLGDSTSDTVTINGSVALALPDDRVSAFELAEGLNSYFKVATSNGAELITLGTTPKLTVLNTTEAISATDAPVLFAGGVGIAKKLFVGTDLTVGGNVVLGNEVSTDTVNVTGRVDVLVPDNTASTFVIRENLSNYLTVVTTNTDESISIGTTPKLKVLNVTDSSSKDTGALIVEGGAGIEKNLTVGLDLQVDRNAVVTGDLAVNGGDLTTTAAAFNLVNANATTVNFASAGTTINIGAATGTTTIKHNVDIDGDLNVDGGDLTVGSVAFNLANTTATTVNFAGAATTLTMAATSGTTTIRNNVDIDGDLNVDGGDLTTGATTFNLLDTTATTINFGGAATLVDIGSTSGTTTVYNNLVAEIDLAVKGNNLTTNKTTFNLVNTTAETVNFAGAGTAITMGAATGATTVRHALNVAGDLAVNGGDLTTTATTFNLLPTNALTVNAFSVATDLRLGGATGTTTINNDLAIAGTTVFDGDLAVNGGDLTSSSTTFNLLPTTTTTVNAFGSATTVNIGATTGSTVIKNNLDVDGDVNIDGEDLTVSTATFNLANTAATTVNAFGAATSLVLAATTGTTQVRNNLDVDLDLNVDGGDITTSQTTFNLLNATATTINFAGAATTLEIGSATGNTNINNNLVVDGDVQVKGGDLTTDQSVFNLVNTTATTVNLAGAASFVNIGSVTSTTTVRNDLLVQADLQVGGGDITTNQTSFNLLNANATTVNAFGAAATLNLGADTGTTIVRNNLEVDLNTVLNGTLTVDLGATITGDLAVNGGDLTTSATTFNLVNTTATTGNLFGAATGVNIAAGAASASTLTYGPAITGNTFKLAGTTVGTVNYTTDVTSGIVNAWQSVTGTVNLGKSGTINLGNSTSLTTDVIVGGAISGNSLKIASTAAGTVTLSSDVTTGTVNVFNNVTTGTVNVAGGGASIINLGSTTSTVNIGVLALTTDLAVEYGGTGRSTFTANGVIYGNTTDGLLVTAASDPGVGNATTSFGILTTDASNVPVWTDVIDGGSY